MERFDYGIVAQRPNQATFNITEGLKNAVLSNQIARNLSQSQPDKNKMLADLAQVDPRDAISQYQDPTAQKKYSWQLKQEAQATPDARAILAEREQVLNQAVQARIDNPRANIAPYLNKIGQLEARYGAITGVPIREKTTGKMIMEMAKARGYDEKAGDDTYQASQKVADKILAETDTILKEYRTGAPSLSKALDLMASSVEDPANLNPSAVASAIKMYVRSLDNSVVNAGEINQVSGGNVVDMILGFANGLTRGVRYSSDQLMNFYRSMMQVANTANGLLDRYLETIEGQTNAMLQAAAQAGRIPQEQIPEFASSTMEIVRQRMSPYYVNQERETPDFQEVEIFPAMGGRSGGSGKFTDPYEGLF